MGNIVMKKYFTPIVVFALLFGMAGCADDTIRNTSNWTPENGWSATDFNRTDNMPDDDGDTGASETQKPTQPARALTYDEILQLPTDYIGSVERDPYGGFDDFLKSMEQVGAAITLARGEVTEVRHYLTWNGTNAGGMTVSAVRITDVVSDFNGLALSAGDTVLVYEDYYIRFADLTETLPYFAEQSGLKYTPGKWSELDPGTVEMIPVFGESYEKLFNLGSVEIPMGTGSRYTFCLREFPAELEGFGKLYLARGVSCVGMTDVDRFLADARLRVDSDIRMIAGEISNRFPTDEPATVPDDIQTNEQPFD